MEVIFVLVAVVAAVALGLIGIWTFFSVVWNVCVKIDDTITGWFKRHQT